MAARQLFGEDLPTPGLRPVKLPAEALATFRRSLARSLRQLEQQHADPEPPTFDRVNGVVPVEQEN